MKSIFTKLSTLILCGAFAMVGCSDFSADLKELNGKLEDLAATSATKAQVAELEEAIKDLNEKLVEQYATIADVEAVITTVEGVQASLNEAKTNLQAAIDTKADKTALQAAVDGITDALNAAKGQIEGQLGELDSDIKELAEKVAKDLETLSQKVAGDIETLKQNLEGQLGELEGDLGDLEGSVGDLEGSVGDLEENLGNLEGTVGTLQTSLNNVLKDVEDLEGTLTQHHDAFENYKKEVSDKFDEVSGEIEEVSENLTKQIDELKEQMTGKADAELVANVTNLQNALSGVNSTLSTLASSVAAKADKADIQKVETELAADIAALEKVVKNWSDKDTVYDDTELRATVAAATKEYKSLVADLQSQINALENTINGIHNELSGIQGELNDMKTELRSVVAVPQTMYNGTKAVKFHRIEGENVLKTYADVSYHFNPANFDATKATYEIVAEPVEFMTKAIFAEDPAIEIIGSPVQENGKVTFHLERGEGTGNMFALKVTLEDGCVIYSDYLAILDEATYCIATARSSFQVERLAFNFPSLTSISAIIEYVQSLGETIEDFESTILAIQAAVEAMQNNDITSAIENLISIPGLRKETATIEGVGVYKVQVETLDAEEIIESLQNAQSIDEIRKIITDLLGKAQGLGEAGSSIINGLDQAFGNSGLNELFGQYDNLLNFQLPDLILTYDKAVAELDQYQAELDNARAELVETQAKLDAIIAGLDETTRNEIAALEAEIEELNAQIVSYEAESAALKVQLESASGLDWLKISAKITEVEAKIVAAKTSIETKDATISIKAGAEYIPTKLELELKEAGIKTAELLVTAARKTVDLADQAVKNAEERLANLETEILNKIKNYIFENTELGQYIKELENALGEQAWEAKKKVAQGTAELFAIDALIADLIQNYHAANQKVVDDFANSLFGRVAYLIQTQEAADAFELIGLTDLYVVLKQLPDLLTLIIKYYPAGVDLTNFTNFNDFGSIFSDYLTDLIPTTEVAWEIDYLLAE